MEYIDVYDENGQKTNIIRSKNLIYKTGSWHRSVHIWIMNSQGNLLIQRRALNKETFAGLWAISVAGHVQSGETSLDAVKRELKEEIDVDLNIQNLTHLFTIKRYQPSKYGELHVLDDVYLLKYNLDLSNPKLQREELTNVAYISPFELEKALKSGDSRFVPYTEEHAKLFDYLRQKMSGDNYETVNTNKIW